MKSHINCLTSLTLTVFMLRHAWQKRGIIPFLLLLSVVFFFFFLSPGLTTCGETGGEREREGGGTEFK